MFATHPIQNESQFPTKKYILASKQWLGPSLIKYPSLKKVIGDRVNGKDVIDIGCGDGEWGQQLVKLGANKVVGIDSDQGVILDCKTKFNYQTNLVYREESSLDLSEEATYDFAFAVFVLHFSNNVAELQKSLTNIARSLKPGGEFIGFTVNGVGDYNPTRALGIQFGATVVLNTIPPKDGERLKIEFYNPEGEVIGDADMTFFYRSTYEHCLKAAGFVDIEWIDPIISDEGLAKYGPEFFSAFFNPPKDVIFRARIPETETNSSTS